MRSVVNPFTTRFLRHKKRKIILHVWWAIARGNKSFSPLLRTGSAAQYRGCYFTGVFLLCFTYTFVLCSFARRSPLPSRSIFLSFRRTKRIATVSTNTSRYIRLRTHPFFQPIFPRLIGRIYSYRPLGKCSISESRTPWRRWALRREKNR